ncbi:cytosolic phospholipase A2 gamma-like [Astyanax mexicanus]|uniref:cytosolic phospholipase A2 gamma-like n=1 Tax=Astyanax mexicanus TaxID=7994 RepID=UPI0020CB08D4|nr:cytosolic phospholipase A2 gamma-like [Astyanax mexicanus]
MEEINVCESSEVRIGHTLNEAEKHHVANRAATVLQCLKQHDIPCNAGAPKIAVMGSGGGLRAMVGLLGSLSQLKEEGLLDSITYLSGVSGSTWCMASLYKESDWSTNLEAVKDEIKARLTDTKVSRTKRGKKLKKYFCEKDNFSLTDVWAAMNVSYIVNEIDEHRLSDQRSTYSNDPYPIYTVIDKKCKYDRLHADCWFEITPDESGYSLTGAFVDSSCWGSQFENGQKINKQPEIDILFLQGLCGSAIADMEEILKFIFSELLMLSKEITEEGDLPQTFNAKAGCKLITTLLELYVSFLSGEDHSVHCETLDGLLKGHDILLNFLDKCDKSGHKISSTLHLVNSETFLHIYMNVTLIICECYFDWFADLLDEMWIAIVRAIEKAVHWYWGTTYNFVYKMKGSQNLWDEIWNAILREIEKAMHWIWRMTYNHDDKMKDSILKSEKREYEDAGLLNNSPYFSVLRQERDIDLIISLDFSEGDPFKTVVDTAKICKELNMAFPEVVIPSGENTEPQDFYVFCGSTKTPTVIHIPLFNCINCTGEVEKWKETYKTNQMEYTESMISDLMKKAGLNISNNKENLLKWIKYVTEQKKFSTAV